MRRPARQPQQHSDCGRGHEEVRGFRRKISLPSSSCRTYMLERLLERIFLSKYKHNFILKGGFLISAIVGLDTRATMDLDTTIKGFTLTHDIGINIFILGNVACSEKSAYDTKIFIMIRKI